mmetsp:Transcript_17366/g.27748  ORF Transcript_17366/g.27748 Transcript_17366/m.27748 type:complete len:107 (-) Transcript_17366:12-332(-)
MSPTFEQLYEKKKISGNSIEEIIKLTKGFHFGIACQKYFVASHGGNPHEDLISNVGTHPNQYFDQSWKYYKEKADKEAEAKAKKEMKKVEKKNSANRDDMKTEQLV